MNLLSLSQEKSDKGSDSYFDVTIFLWVYKCDKMRMTDSASICLLSVIAARVKVNECSGIKRAMSETKC